MDRLLPSRRSFLMSRVRAQDTGPEIIVRKIAHALGFRFRLHDKKLPGKPDLVFPRLRSVILVHGCFWHRHPGCRKASNPSSNVEFWNAKFARNVTRDALMQGKLEALGWRVLIVWECETKDRSALRVRVRRFLTKARKFQSCG
jgi:DNA mismatch endonuclease, patch repair protein